MSASSTMRPLVKLAHGLTVQNLLAPVQGFRAHPRPFGPQMRSISRRRARIQKSRPALERDVDSLVSAQRNPPPFVNMSRSNMYDSLETFLPPALRRQQEASGDRPASFGTLGTTLPTFLREFRQVSPAGALSFLAAQDDRLEALVYLANKLVETDVEPPSSKDPFGEILQQSLWLQEKQKALSLDELSEEPFVFSPGSRSEGTRLNPEDVIDNEGDTNDHGTAYYEAIGELWAALGEITIRASNSTEDGAQILMQHAHLIFANMHSKGLVPPDAYGFDESINPKAVRKPPYLHVVGSRMMAAMSDATWSLQSSEKPLAQGSTGSEFPPVVVEKSTSKPHQLHPNAWLEFVLWVCVRRGYFIEASRLLSAACLASSDTRWKALTWDQVLAMQTEHQKRQQSWFDRLMSVDEGYNPERPLIEMPARTLSCEVIVAIIGGLLCSEDAEHVRSARRVSFYAYCQALGDRDEDQILMLNAVLQQLEESSDLDPRVVSHLLLQQIQSASHEQTAVRRAETVSPQETIESPSLSAAFTELQPSPYLSHTIVAWESMILHGEVADALEVFESLRNIHQLVSKPKLHDNQTRKRKGFTPPKLTSADPMALLGPLSWSTITSPQVPEPILASFLQLLVRTNNLEGAKILLYDEFFGVRNNDTNTTFQPALLQAAVAIGDRELLATVIRRFDVGLEALPDDVLYALYEAQVWLGSFKDTTTLLRFMQEERRLPLSPRLVIATACKFIALVRSAWTADTYQLRQILTDLLNGKFLPARDPSRQVDYTEVRVVSQLARILRKAHPSIEQLRLSRDVYLTGQTNTPIAISADAFNPLLKTVAEVRGTDVARKFFDIWCQCSPTPVLDEYHQGVRVVPAQFEDEKVVTPTLETVQILLRSPLRDLRAWSSGGSQLRDPSRHLLKWVENQTEVQNREPLVDIALPPQVPHRELFEWGAQTLRKMGYDDFAVNNVIPGAFPDAK